ncbi:MAG: nucleotidyltransferase domain-containing protein [archaeon]|nr:nucleotidyltransferase domain-containing protein [archaeon]
MKKDGVLCYVYDFVRILAGKTGDEVKDIILFGSVARGDFDEESDVDIFVNVSENKEKTVQKAIDKAQNEFEVYSRRTWKLQGVSLPINCIAGDINSRRWSELRREIISSGISLYGRYREFPKKFKHCFIFSFSLSGLKPGDRVSVVRRIYGYSTKKDGKVYKHTGILYEAGGEKVNPSVVLVPDESHKMIFDFFKKNNVSFRIREVWMG